MWCSNYYRATLGFLSSLLTRIFSDLATLAIVDPETTALSQPNTVGEIWVDSPSIAFGFWDLPKLSQSIFHALPLIVPVDTMMPEVYDPVPAGFLRTGLLGGLIEGRVVVFGLCTDKIQQQSLPDQRMSGLWAERALEYEHHYAKDLTTTIMERIVGFSCWYGADVVLVFLLFRKGLV